MTRKAQNTAAKAAAKAPTRDITPKAAKKHQRAPKASRETPPPPTSKSAAILAALQRDGGATIEALMAASGWQAHSVRGFLSGTVRKKLALDLVADGSGSARTYRINMPAAVAKTA